MVSSPTHLLSSAHRTRPPDNGKCLTISTTYPRSNRTTVRYPYTVTESVWERVSGTFSAFALTHVYLSVTHEVLVLSLDENSSSPDLSKVLFRTETTRHSLRVFGALLHTVPYFPRRSVPFRTRVQPSGGSEGTEGEIRDTTTACRAGGTESTPRDSRQERPRRGSVVRGNPFTPPSRG